VLVEGLCIRSRPGAALLNVGADSLESRETRWPLDLRRASGYKPVAISAEIEFQGVVTRFSFDQWSCMGLH
jgi:hypothetical protein